MINYSEKFVVLPPMPVEFVCLFLSSVKVGSSESNNWGYVLLMENYVKLKPALDEIPVVREYTDVFPDDILKFPLEREIEFSMELVS